MTPGASHARRRQKTAGPVLAGIATPDSVSLDLHELSGTHHPLLQALENNPGRLRRLGREVIRGRTVPLYGRTVDDDGQKLSTQQAGAVKRWWEQVYRWLLRIKTDSRSTPELCLIALLGPQNAVHNVRESANRQRLLHLEHFHNAQRGLRGLSPEAARARKVKEAELLRAWTLYSSNGSPDQRLTPSIEGGEAGSAQDAEALRRELRTHGSTRIKPEALMAMGLEVWRHEGTLQWTVNVNTTRYVLTDQQVWNAHGQIRALWQRWLPHQESLYAFTCLLTGQTSHLEWAQFPASWKTMKAEYDAARRPVTSRLWDKRSAERRPAR